MFRSVMRSSTRQIHSMYQTLPTELSSLRQWLLTLTGHQWKNITVGRTVKLTLSHKSSHYTEQVAFKGKSSELFLGGDRFESRAWTPAVLSKFHIVPQSRLRRFLGHRSKFIVTYSLHHPVIWRFLTRKFVVYMYVHKKHTPDPQQK